MRSPSTAPPLNGLVGSIHRTATVFLTVLSFVIRLSIRLLFPAPGGPVMPILRALPVLGYKSERIFFFLGELFSIREIIEAIYLKFRVKSPLDLDYNKIPLTEYSFKKAVIWNTKFMTSL